MAEVRVKVIQSVAAMGEVKNGETVEMDAAVAEQMVARGFAEYIHDPQRKPTTSGHASIAPIDNRPNADEFDLSHIVVDQGLNAAPHAAEAAMQQAPERSTHPRPRTRTAARGKAAKADTPAGTDEGAEAARNAATVPGA